MELPHFTLALRRFRRIPGRPTILLLTAWLALVLLEISTPRGVFTLFGRGARMINSFDYVEYCYLAILILGYFILYYVIANVMRGSVDRLAGGEWGWFTTPVRNSHALLGVVASALLAGLIPAAGLFTFLASINPSACCYGFYTAPDGCQLGLDIHSFYMFTGFFVLRLLHFSLMAATVHLAFRRTPAAPFVTPALALAAVTVSFWEGRYVFDTVVNSLIIDFPPWQWMVAGLTGLAGICLLLLLAAQREGISWLHVLAAAVLVVFPVATGAGAFVSETELGGNLNPNFRVTPGYAPGTLEYCAYGQFMTPVHASLGNVYPALESAFYDRLIEPDFRGNSYARGSGRRDWGVVRYNHWYGQPQTDLWFIAKALAGYLAALLIWWFTALLSLDIARNPQRYRRRSRRPGRDRPTQC